MIAKSCKFPMRREFYSWRKLASLTHTPHLLLYTRSSPHPCVAVVVPAKKVKLAAHRNTLRRTLLGAALPLAQSRSQDIVIFLKSLTDPGVLLSELK